VHALLQPLSGIKDFGRLSLFVVFVILGTMIWRAPANRRAPAILRLITFVLVLSCLVGLSQIESWPFTHWALVHTLRASTMDQWEWVGVDRGGRSHPIDPRVIEPLGMEEFDTWMRMHFFSATAEGQRSVAAWILARTEQARSRFLRTGKIGTDGWLLGPIAAPHHFTRGVVWQSARDVPPDAFTRLQIWRSEWDIEARALNDNAVSRKLLYESP